MFSILWRFMYVALVATVLVTVERGAMAAHRFPAVIATFPVGFNFPLGLAVDSLSNRIYVVGGACCTEGPGGAVSAIDGTTHAVLATIPIAGGAVYGAVNPLTGRLYVTHGNGGPDIVTVIDTITHAVVTTIPLGSDPFGIVVNPATNRVYVVNSRSHSVSVLDGATNTVVATIATPPFPLSAAIDVIANRVFVTFGANVAVIDGATNTVVATIPGNSGSFAFGMGFEPLVNRIYVPRFIAGPVEVIDAGANALVASIAVGSQPNGVGVNGATSRVYVGVRSTNSVAVIDSAANQQIGMVAVGSTPFDVAANPVTDRVYVTNTLSHTVSVIADVFADLSVDVSDSPDPVRPGEEVTYTGALSNHGISSATNVSFSQVLPSKIAGPALASSTQGTCTVAGDTVTCNLGSIAAGASATVTVTIRVTKPGTATSTASVMANEPDPIAGNNTDTTTTTVAVPGPPH